MLRPTRSRRKTKIRTIARKVIGSEVKGRMSSITMLTQQTMNRLGKARSKMANTRNC